MHHYNRRCVVFKQNQISLNILFLCHILHIYQPVFSSWVLYFFLVSFVQSPFKEALRDLSCSSDPSELPSPGKKGPRQIKTGEKLHRTEWLLFCPPASTTLAQSWDITAHNKSPFSIFKLNLNEYWGFENQYWESLILIFKISPYIRSSRFTEHSRRFFSQFW